MLSKVLLGAAVTAGVASACTLELNVFYDPSCRAARAGNPKEFPGSSEGQCRFAPAVQDYTVWQCQGNGVSLSYFKDDACSVADGASALAQPGVCTYDAKSGVYIKVGGDCCGMESKTNDVAKKSKKSRFGFANTKNRLSKRLGRGKHRRQRAPMPGSDNADAIHYKSVKAKQAFTKTLSRLQGKAKHLKLEQKAGQFKRNHGRKSGHQKKKSSPRHTRNGGGRRTK